MTTIHVQQIGNSALLPQNEFERLVELARRSEEVALNLHPDDIPTVGVMRLIEQSGAFNFWLEEGEDVYSAEDGEWV